MVFEKWWSAWKNEQMRGKRRWAPTYKRLPFSWAYYAKMSVMFFIIGAFSELGLISAGNFDI